MSERSPQEPERDISPEELSAEVSLLMTKPENTDTKAPLLLFLKSNGLKAEVFRITLNQEMLGKLYPDIQNSPGLIQATNDHMLGREVEVFLVTKDATNDSKDSVLDQVVKLAGARTNPGDNENGTLRKHLSGGTSVYTNALGEDALYFKNGFHRPVKSQELVEQLDAIGLLEEAKRLVK